MAKNFLTYLALLAALVMMACADDDTFSTSTSNRLTFSADTVSLDTVFSRVPSSTRTFWVHNNSSDGIRCASIKLENGNQTGFRVNVNGVYLGETQGYQLSDEEIRKGDSIRVFVEVTTPYNNQKVPTVVSDNLVFLLESGVQQKVNLRAWSWDAEMLHDVVISKDSTLSSEKPLVIYGGITVNEGSTLTIPAGQTLYFHDGAGIDVKGRLVCAGEVGNEVVLRGDRLDNMFDYLPYDGVSGQWRGIRFYGSSYDNSLTFTDLHSACSAIECDSSDVSRQKLDVISSTVHNNKGCGVKAVSSRVNIENSQITNTLDNCLDVTGGAVNVNNCTIAQFYPFDSSRGNALSFSNNEDDIAYPLTELNIRNSIITGYAEDVIMGNTVDSLDANYLFDHCLLRTPEIEDSVRCVANIWEDVEDTICSGWKNFQNIDIDLQRYDFHLSEKSLAIGAADPLTSLPTDREAAQRDDKPDIGCYERSEGVKE